MIFFLNFIPIFLFMGIVLGSGIYYSVDDSNNAFYQIPLTTAILPSIIFAWIIHKKDTKHTLHDFINGARHPDIITMCCIFLLAGALSSVSKSIGGVESVVNLVLIIIPQNFLLVGVFITSALISTAIGTSMGTIAALASFVVQLSSNGALNLEYGIATLIGGAMFGDNISIISDTTIASVSSQKASLKQKLKLNFKIAIVAAITTILLLYYCTIAFPTNLSITCISNEYKWILIFPYVFLIILAVYGLNVFIVLVSSIVLFGFIGCLTTDYNIIQFSRDIADGFHEMHEIMLLSMLIGALSGLSNQNTQELADKISKLLPSNAGIKSVELLIAMLVSIFNIMLANNVIAIILSGKIAKELAVRYKVKPYRSAVWLDTFSCAFPRYYTTWSTNPISMCYS